MAAEIDKLEQIVDSIGLGQTVAYLSDICFAKAQYIAENWQDGITDNKTLIKQWQHDAKVLHTASNKLHDF